MVNIKESVDELKSMVLNWCWYKLWPAMVTKEDFAPSRTK
jgi:hypothetical protein